MEPEDLDKMNAVHRRRLIAMADAYAEILKLENEVLGKSRNGHDVVFIAEDIAVLIDSLKPSFADAPFTYVLKVEGEWKHSNSYYSSHEVAYLAALAHKHLGYYNNDFALFAARMLKIKE